MRRDLSEFAGSVPVFARSAALWQTRSVPEEEKTRILLELTAGGEPLVRNFLQAPGGQGPRGDPGVGASDILVEMVDAAAGVVEVEITTARPLAEELAAEIKHSIEASLKKTIQLKLEVDDELLGGMKLRIGDKIADASLRHRLEQLRARLVSPMARLEGSVEAAS